MLKRAGRGIKVSICGIMRLWDGKVLEGREGGRVEYTDRGGEGGRRERGKEKLGCLVLVVWGCTLKTIKKGTCGCLAGAGVGGGEGRIYSHSRMEQDALRCFYLQLTTKMPLQGCSYYINSRSHKSTILKLN